MRRCTSSWPVSAAAEVVLGCGGREALQSIQRWPQHWDGAIAWYTAWNQASAMLGGQVASIALSKPGGHPNAKKRLGLFRSAMQACDAQDGLIDGLISNPAACNATFYPATATANVYLGTLRPERLTRTVRS
jgi:hypothetical protein